MKNRRTAIMPYKPIYVSDNTLSLDVEDAKRLILFTGHKDKLTGLNEFQLDPRIQTGYGVAVNDSAMPFDNGVGTVRLLNDVTDNVWLSRVDNSDKLKVLPSGFLQANSHLTVDKTAHTITEEFIIKNEATSNSTTVIDSCDSATGWSIHEGSGTITVENGRLKVVGNANSGGMFRIKKNANINIGSKNFICSEFESSVAGQISFACYDNVGYYSYFNGTYYAIDVNVPTKYVMPLTAPIGADALPRANTGSSTYTTIGWLYIGVSMVGANAPITMYVNNIQADVGKPAYIEMQVPDKLADTSLDVYGWNGTTYNKARSLKLNPSVVAVYNGSGNLVLSDGTTLNDVYGVGEGRAFYPKSISSNTVTGLCNGLSSTITYSQNKGTRCRVGLGFSLPPSDAGRTNINKIRLKLVTYYNDVNGNTVPDVSINENIGTITGSVTKLTDGGFKFDGTTGCVKCGTSSILGPSGAMTIGGWVRIDEINASHVLFGRGKGLASGFENGYTVSLSSDNKIYFDLYSSSTRSTTFYSLNPTVGTWYHILCSWDGTTNANSTAIYVNGVLVKNGTSTVASIAYSAGLEFVIGADSSSSLSWQTLNGAAKDIRLFNRAVTVDEATKIYNGVNVEEGLAGRWLLNSKNMGTTTYEFSQDAQLGTGINLMKKPYFCFYNPSKKIVDYYIVTKKPLGGQFSYDENGDIYNITFNLDPGTKVYKGKLNHINLTQDTNSDKIPNFVDSSEIVSIEQLIGHLDFVYDYITKVDLTSSITTNDFDLTLDNCPTVYATSANNRVYANDVQLIPIGTAVTKDGVLNYFDVAGKSTIRIDEGQNCNAGECKLFDTVTSGNTDESTWKRVYRTDWVFTGDCIIENGMFKVRITTGNIVLSKIQYNSSNIVNLCYLGGGTITSWVINALSPDRVLVTITLSNSATRTVEIKKGFYGVMVNYPTYVYLLSFSNSSPRFICNLDEILLDRTTTAPYSKNIDTVAKSIIFAIEPISQYIQVAELTVKDSSVFIDPNLQGVPSKPTFIGSIPFDCSKLFIGPASYALEGGGTRVIDATYPDGQYIETISGGNYVISPKLSIPVAGTYTVYIKAELTSGTGPGRFYIYDYTVKDEVFEITNATINNGYYSYTFTLSAEQITHDLKLVLRGETGTTTRYGYSLFVPTSLIEWNAKKSMIYLNETVSIEKI